MNKKVLFTIVAIIVVILGFFSLTACNPRAYCYNEPTIGADGRAVNNITCVSQGSQGSHQ